MATKELKLSQRPAASTPALSELAAAHIGHVVAIGDDGTITVTFAGNHSPVAARLAITASRQRVETAIVLQQPVVLLFEQGNPQRPLIVGIVGSLTEDRDSSPSPDQQFIEADVDGKRVRVIGQDEIVLECGQASITLRRNGRVLIRGTHIETDSAGTNRIKGGQVRIN